MSDDTTTQTDEHNDGTDPITGAPESEDNGTSKPVSQFTSDDNIAAAQDAAGSDAENDDTDPAIDGVGSLSDDDEVAERSPDGSDPGTFRKAFILDRLDLTADGKVPANFDHDPNIDGTRSFGVQSGVRFTGPIKLISNRQNPDAPGTRVLVYGGPAVPASSAVDEDGAYAGDYYDPTVENAGEPDETTKSNSAQATDQAE